MVEFSLGDMRASGPLMQLDAVSVDVQNSSTKALDNIDRAAKNVIQVRSQIGALQNRFELSIDATNNIIERVQGVESSIRDADLAQAVSHLTRSQIMSQTATNLAKEADIDIDGLLSLLR
jgi:flagellin